MKTRVFSSLSVLVLCAGSVLAQADLGSQQAPATSKPGAPAPTWTP